MYIIDECVDIDSEEHFSSVINKINSLLEVDKSISLLGNISDDKFNDFSDIVNVSFPEEWVNYYLNKNYNKIDPVLKKHFLNFQPQIWSETYSNFGKIDKDFLQNSIDFKLINGITYGIKNKSENTGSLFTFSTESNQIPDTNIEIVKILVPHLHQALIRIVDNRDREQKFAKYKISEREIEVLKWIKKGKTNWEISIILNISERTVKFHVSNILKKLEAMTRAHAVAISIELGIVSL